MSTSPALRPMNVGDLLDQAISLYRRNFVTLVGLIAVISVPLLALQLLGTLLVLPADPLIARRFNIELDPTLLFLMLGLTGATAAILGAIASIFQTAALSVVVSERYLDRTITIKEAYQRTWEHWKSLLGSILVMGLAYVGLVVLFLIPCLGWVGAPILFIAVSTRWAFVSQTIMLEQLGATDSLRRSWNLVSGSFWRVLGITFILGIFIEFLKASPSYVVSFLTLVIPSFVLSTVLSSVAATSITMLVTPIQFAVLTLLYYDLRIRTEGFDLQLLAQQLAPTASPQALGASA